MKEVKVVSINISTEKGTIKQPISKAKLTNKGIEGDAHAGLWHRQVSLLGIESIKRFEAILKRNILPGEFAENITTEGLELMECQPLDTFSSCQVELMVTQIGKSCHGDGCSIFQQVGKCVMPKEGIFAKVRREGILKTGDSFVYHPKVFKIAVITLSDRASSGEYNDLSGEIIKQKITEHFTTKKRLYKTYYHLIPDNSELLKNLIVKAIEEKIDYIFTSGGTGISPKDITIETIKPLIDKEIPGIMEYIRIKYGQQKPQALLSRSIAGIAQNSCIFTLPGSTRATEEYMSEILPQLEHITYMLYGIDKH
ncbi:MAG: molybdopterin-binding protein [Bacteroidales bacterium]|nr:molybdopterin-binding protein [Bacteroidales bacterium]